MVRFLDFTIGKPKMASGSRMSKVEQFPQIHQFHLNFQMSADDSARTKCGTIIPLVWADEAQIASTKETNPRNATFAPMVDGACCPQSNVNSISGKIEMDLTKSAWNTDKLRNLKVMVMPIAVAFEDIEATDEKTTTSIKAILELTSEATDRQVYPIYNDVPLTGTKVDMGANQLGLTATTALEGIAFDQQQLYDALSWYTNKGKLAACIGQIKYLTLGMAVIGKATDLAVSAKTNIINFRLNLPKKVQHMNPYTFFGILIYIPQLGVETQYGIATDTSAVDHVHIDLRAQFNEWNPNFNMESNFA